MFGEVYFSMITALLITLVCPILSVIQNFIFGFALHLVTYKFCNFQRLRVICYSIRYQTTILNYSKFKIRTGLWSVIFCYGIYLIPAVSLTAFLTSYRSDAIFCRTMKTSTQFWERSGLLYKMLLPKYCFVRLILHAVETYKSLRFAPFDKFS